MSDKYLLNQYRLSKLSKLVTVYLISNDLSKWSFCFNGLENTPYENGIYYGVVDLSNCPIKPPVIMFKTPNGRFSINTPICTNMSIYHNSWNNEISIISILEGLVYLMNEPPSEDSIVGHLKMDDETKRLLAHNSMNYNFNKLI